MEIASAFVSLLPSARGFSSNLESEVGGEVNSAGKSLGSGFGKMFALAGGALAAAGIGSFLKDSIGEAREAQKVGALTTNVIKQTGGAANITAAQVGNLSSAISLKTGMDDEAIQSGANLLLTFKNVRNEVGAGNQVFNRATQAAADLSAAGFGALEGTSKQLGKALNDPIKGISALSRSGVTFTAQQQEQIKTLVASGDVLKAQKIILGEVESQVGGAAAASATYGEKAGVAFGNIKEQVGTALLPVLDGFFKLFLGAVPTVTRLIDGIGPAFSRIGAFFAPLIAQVQGFFGGAGGGGILASIQTFAASVQANFLPVLQTMAATFTGKILPAITSLASYIAANLFPVFTQVAGIITSKVLPILSSLAQFFYGKVIPAVAAVASSVAAKLKPVFNQLVATFRSKVLPTIEVLLDKFTEYQPTIQKVILVVVKIIGKVLEFAAAVLGKVLPPVIKFAGFLIANVIPAVASVIGVLIKIIAKVIDFGGAMVGGVQAAAKFLSGIKDKIGAALDFVAGIPGKVVAFFANAGTLLLGAGGRLMDGLKQGIENKIEDAIQAVRDGLQKIKDLLPGSPIKNGPLKGWNGGTPGKLLMEMLAKGLAYGSKSVQAEMTKVAEKLGKTLDGLKSKFSSLKSDFASLAGSVGSAFNPDMFGAIGKAAEFAEDGITVLAPATTALQEFMAGLNGNNSNLTAMLAAFDQLKAAGASTGFLSALFQSGNTQLASQLATAGPDAVKQASALFEANGALAATLGNAVATNELGPKMDSVRDEIAELRKDMKVLLPLIAKDVEKGAEKGTRKGNDDRNKDSKQRGRAGR